MASQSHILNQRFSEQGDDACLLYKTLVFVNTFEKDTQQNHLTTPCVFPSFKQLIENVYMKFLPVINSKILGYICKITLSPILKLLFQNKVAAHKPINGVSLTAQDSKESTCHAGDLGSIPESGRSPGEGNDYPFQYSCLENSMDRGAWQATVHGVTKSQIGMSN